MKYQSATAKLNVIARAPFHIYYEGTAKVVTASNKVGKFDILPGHADFFSVMSPGEVIIETDSDTINFPLINGIVSVRGDEVMMFVNI